MGATYIGLDAGGRFHSDAQLYFDEDRSQKRLEEGQVDSERVVAITCLQAPRLADDKNCDGNAVFIANSREDVPTLIAGVRRLRKLLADHQITI